MILITGATGHLGAAVIENLLNELDPSEIAIYARDEKKAERWKALGLNIHIGDFRNKEAIKKACLGINKLLFIPIIGENAFQQHQNVIDAAYESGVKHIYYAGGAFNHSVKESELGMLRNSVFLTERYIRQTARQYTIFHSGPYLETIPLSIGDNLPINGIDYPAGHGKLAFAARDEVGEAIAKIMLKKNDINLTYILSGHESYSFIDVADILSNLSGHEILYLNSDEASFTSKLRQAGIGEEQMAISLLFSRIIKNGEYEVCDGTLEQILQRKPITLKDYLKITYQP